MLENNVYENNTCENDICMINNGNYMENSDNEKPEIFSEINSLLSMPIKIVEKKINLSDLSEDELVKKIYDFGESIKIRNECMNILSKNFNEKKTETLIDVVNRLKNMYIFSTSNGIEKTLFFLITNTDIPYIEKYQISNILIHISEKILSKEPVEETDDISLLNRDRFISALESLENICNKGFSNEDFPSPCRIESIYHFIKNEAFFPNVIKYAIIFLKDSPSPDNFNDNFKYKTLLSLEKRCENEIKKWTNPVWKRYLNPWIQREKENESKKNDKNNGDENDKRDNDKNDENKEVFPEPEKFIEYCMEIDRLFVRLYIYFLELNEVNTDYKILTSQNLLSKPYLNTIDESLVSKVENYLLSLLRENTNLLTDQRLADVSDILLRYGRENAKEEAKKFIFTLGFKDNKNYVKTVFNNAQNIHVEEISESALEILEYLTALPLMKINGENIVFKNVYDEIMRLIGEVENYLEDEEKRKVEVSLNRIFIDRALYSKLSCSLENILLKVWSYIQSHKYKTELINRLIEELIDMSGWCSSGYAFRLLNTLSGFGEFNIRISWTDQIIANFSGRFYALINNIKNENKKQDILLGFTIEDSDPDSKEIRDKFKRFFMKKIPYIREEMYSEFKEYISDTDFDLSFRKAIMQIIEGVKLK